MENEPTYRLADSNDPFEWLETAVDREIVDSASLLELIRNTVTGMKLEDWFYSTMAQDGYFDGKNDEEE